MWHKRRKGASSRFQGTVNTVWDLGRSSARSVLVLTRGQSQSWSTPSAMPRPRVQQFKSSQLTHVWLWCRTCQSDRGFLADVPLWWYYERLGQFVSALDSCQVSTVIFMSLNSKAQTDAPDRRTGPSKIPQKTRPLPFVLKPWSHPRLLSNAYTLQNLILLGVNKQKKSWRWKTPRCWPM